MFDDESSTELDDYIDNNELIERFSRRALAATKARIRNAINRESAAADKRSAEMASQLINQMDVEQSIHIKAEEKRKRSNHAVIVGVSRVTSAVLDSIGVKSPIVLEQSNSKRIASARTNFKKISISVNTSYYDENDRASVAKLIHLTKGLVYHEGGHIKYTTPFQKLMDMVGRPSDGIEVYSKMKAWNILEDQRMESAMCALSPMLAKYFTTIVMEIVIDKSAMSTNWPWIAGRTYLPSHIRQMFRDAAETHPKKHLIDKMNACIMRYRKSTDPVEMVSCVIEFSLYLDEWGAGGRYADEHDNYSFEGYSTESANPDDIPEIGDFVMEEPTKPSEQESSPTESTSDRGGSTNSESPTTTAGAPNNKPETPPDVDAEREHEKHEISEQIKEEIKEEIDNNYSSSSEDEIDEFISNVNEVANKSMLPDRTISKMTDTEIAKSIEVSNSMMNILERLIVQVEPTWRSYMEEGVIDPTAYALRDPGDTNFWSGLDGEGGNGHDLAISVVLDSSGSMTGDMDRVSIAAMGIRNACDKLGIPCTITTFNDDVFMVADATENVGFIRVSAEGGTSAMNALKALEEQKHGKSYHLVIILTDGEWFDVSDVRLWSQPQRHIVIAGFGSHLEPHIRKKYPDHWVTIDDPMELPKLVTDSLLQHFV